MKEVCAVVDVGQGFFALKMIIGKVDECVAVQIICLVGGVSRK